jgi:F-type H+-transporting ATPase subunit delta
MAELATIARPYADALFKASTDHLEETAQWLDRLAEIVVNPDLIRLSSHPKSTPEQVLGLIQDVMPQALPAVARQLLRMVLENGRLSAVPEMATQFRAQVNDQGGVSDATVFSPFPMDDTLLADVVQVLEKRFDRKLHVSVQLQPELIGGIRVVVGDEVFDTSVKARLEQMKVALAA